MRSLSLVLLICSLSFIACGQKEDQTSGTSSNESKRSENINMTAEQTREEKSGQGTHDPDEGDTDKHESERKEHSDKSGGIRVNFPVGATQVTLNGTISGFSEQKTYVFEVSKGQKLTASVKPGTSNGNIRIAQIISPSGKADGPFGDKMTYSLNESGDWKLILSENMMSGDPWKGEYFLTLEIK